MKITKKSLVSLLLLTTFMFLSSAAFVYAINNVNVPGLSQKSITQIIKDTTKWIAGFVALIAVLVIIIAGIMWGTAGGDEDRQGNARKLLIGGVVGLFVALAAMAIVNAVIGLM